MFFTLITLHPRLLSLLFRPRDGQGGLWVVWRRGTDLVLVHLRLGPVATLVERFFFPEVESLLLSFSFFTPVNTGESNRDNY